MTLLVCAALRVEARALRRGLTHARVLRTGYGPVRAGAAARTLPGFDALAVAGVAGAVAPRLRPGDVLVATEVRGAGRTLPAEPLAADLTRTGLVVHAGPLVTTGHLVRGAERAALAEAGCLAADMESAPLVAAAGDRPVAVVRVIVDAPGAPLFSPATLWRGRRALRTLRGLAPALERWAAAATADNSATLTRPEEVRDR